MKARRSWRRRWRSSPPKCSASSSARSSGCSKTIRRWCAGLLSGLTIRLAELTRRLAEMSGARVEARFARLFLKLGDQIGRTDRGGLFVPMPLTRQELADLTGTTIETAIRIMSRWQKEDVLHTEKDGFVLLNREALEDAAAS
jgi:CRP-like cAMP-binding protein